MQRICLWMIIFLMTPFILKAQEARKTEKIKWHSFEEAYKLNKKKPKMIFVDVYTDWCGWCRKMDSETFTNPIIVKYMNNNFYCAKLNAERKDTIVIDSVVFTNPNPMGKRSSHKLAVDLLRGEMSYPAYVFLNEKNQRVTVVNGYRQAKEFEVIIHYFGDDAYTKTPWEDFQPAFKGDIK